MLKVVHIVSSFSLGGVQTGILYSMSDLRKNFDYKIIAFDADERWLKDIPEDVRKNILIIGSSNLLIGSIKALRLLKKIKPDVIVASLWKASPVSVTYKFLNSKVKLVGFYHQNGIIHLAERFFLWLLAKVQDLMFADSTATKIFIEKEMPVKSEIVTIPYLFDFTVSPKTKLFYPTNIKLAYFGRLTQVKRIDRMIEFCRLCKEAGINFKFDIYGKGDIEKYNKAIVDNNLQDKIFICAQLPLDKVQETMKDYDFLLQLSDIEGMALSVVEALSCGLVPIVTPVGEMKNYTKDMNNAIWLYPEFDRNLEQLLHSFKKVVCSPGIYNQMSLNAIHTFDDYPKYSVEFKKGILKLTNKQN